MAAEQYPPDQVDPPAPGEGEPLDDPTEPADPTYTAKAQPSPSINLSPGRSWGNVDVRGYRATNRYTLAARASRLGWGRGAHTVVLSSGYSYATSMPASALAGAVNGPLLLTPPRRLIGAARAEIDRLNPRRVYVVGNIDASVRTRIRNMGIAVTHLAGRNPYQTAAVVASHAVRRGADRRTVIVASGTNWADGLGIAALAAGREWPVLLAAKSTGSRILAERVRDLGASRVLVIARKRNVADSVIRGLPGVQRIYNSTGVGTVAATARRARAFGLRGRPVLVGGRDWADAVAWGVSAGERRNAPVLSNAGTGVAPAVASWLQDVRPSGLNLISGATRLSVTAGCQIRSGRVRSWRCAERTLKQQGYDVRNVDGRVDRLSIWAIYAFEKVAGRSANGSFGDAEWKAMLRNPRVKVRRPDLPKDHVEINLAKQLVLLVENGRVKHQIHTSTGKSSTPTVRGTFTVYEKRSWYQPHNRMYWSIFFYGGYAIHGYPEIPTYPASAGCARTYNGNQDFLYPKIDYGERIYVY